MQEDRHISLCITTYNRLDLLLESFEKVYDDHRISEIIISDDHSDREIYNQLESILTAFPKVKLFRNDTNKDCYVNKKIAIELATNEYVIILDSDNIIDTIYIDKIYAEKWSPGRIFAPVWAMPNFDYREFEGRVIDERNVSQFMDKLMFETALNTCNFFVNRQTYLEAWDSSIDPVTSDSIFMAYKLLERGCQIYFVPGLHYSHLVHDGSHYKTQNFRTPNGFHESILQKLKKMI